MASKRMLEHWSAKCCQISEWPDRALLQSFAVHLNFCSTAFRKVPCKCGQHTRSSKARETTRPVYSSIYLRSNILCTSAKLHCTSIQVDDVVRRTILFYSSLDLQGVSPLLPVTLAGSREAMNLTSCAAGIRGGKGSYFIGKKLGGELGIEPNDLKIV